MEVRFTNEILAAKHERETIKTEKWILLPTYLGDKIASVRAGRVPPEIDVESLVATILMPARSGIAFIQGIQDSTTELVGIQHRAVDQDNRRRFARATGCGGAAR